MRVVTFVVSTFGSLGAQAQALIKDIAKRTNLFVPPSLSNETSWATSSITTVPSLDQLLHFKSANVLQVQVAVRVMLRDHLPDDFLPPPPPNPLSFRLPESTSKRNPNSRSAEYGKIAHSPKATI